MAEKGKEYILKFLDQVIPIPIKKKPRKNWSQSFKSAIKNGDQPEGDLFSGLENKFDGEEW